MASSGPPWICREHTAQLVEHLRDPEASVRHDALLALCEHAELAELYIEAIVLCLEDVDAYVRRSAIDLLICMDNGAAYARRILKCLSDDDENVRRGAVVALSKMGGHGAAAARKGWREIDDPETKDEVRSLFLKRGIDVSAATRCVRYTDELFFPDALEIIFLNPSVSATTPATGARIARCATRQSKDRKSPQTSPQILPIDDLSTAASTPNVSRRPSTQIPKHAVNPFSQYSTSVDF